MVAFNNTFTAAAQAAGNGAYVNDILAAENFISSHWTNSITLNLQFDAQAKGTNGTFLATNSWPSFVNVTYTSLRNALIAHGSSATSILPANDPTGGHTFSLPEAYGRMLGLSAGVSTPDDTVTLNTSYNWSYGQDVIGTIIHEITEGAMGRIGGLGDQNSVWSTLDLFRYSSAGVRDVTDGRDGKSTFFPSTATRCSLSSIMSTTGQPKLTAAIPPILTYLIYLALAKRVTTRLRFPTQTFW